MVAIAEAVAIALAVVAMPQPRARADRVAPAQRVNLACLGRPVTMARQARLEAMEHQQFPTVPDHCNAIPAVRLV